MKTLFIFQPHFIGDIIFCQKIAKTYRQLGYRVIWPIFSQYKWVLDKLYPSAYDPEYPLIEEEFDFKELFIKLANESRSALRGSTTKYNEIFEYNAYFSFLPIEPSWIHRPDLPLMSGKYTIAKINHDDWTAFSLLNRNFSKENELFVKLGLTDSSSYCFVNEHCSTKSVNIEVETNLQIVKMSKIEGYDPFDWLGVIQNADAIVTIDTLIVLLAEILNLKNIPMHIINRYIPPDKVTSYAIGDIVKCPWTFHDEISNDFRIKL